MYQNKKTYLYTFGKHDVKFMCWVYTKASHFKTDVLFCINKEKTEKLCNTKDNTNIWHAGVLLFCFTI